MSREALLAVGIILTCFGADEYLPARVKLPIKLVVGLVLLIAGIFLDNGFLRTGGFYIGR